MGEPVEQRPGEPLRAHDLGPFVEGEIAGDENRPALVPLAENLEKQFRSGFGQRYESQFVDNQQLVACELFLEPEQPFFVPASISSCTSAAGPEPQSRTAVKGKRGRTAPFSFHYSQRSSKPAISRPNPITGINDYPLPRRYTFRPPLTPGNTLRNCGEFPGNRLNSYGGIRTGRSGGRGRFLRRRSPSNRP